MSTEDRTSRLGPPGSPADLDSHPTRITSSDLTRLAPGTLIAGRYRIVEELGTGGMGIVYRARDQVLELDVALKALRPEVAHDRDFLQRFRNELVMARQVTHRNVVRIHDLGEERGLYFMTMDLVEGRSLRDVMRDEGRLEVGRALAIVRQIAAALGEAHREGIIHRDLKPENILLDAAGEAYVTDFGVSRSLHSPGMTRTGVVLGTPDYLSPEQARGEKVDGRSDLYTLGLILVEMLSGQTPFAGGSLFEILAQRISGKPRTLAELGVAVPPRIAALVDRCLASDPDERYASAAELLADLEEGAGGRRRERRSPWRSVGWGAATLLLYAAGAVIAYRAFVPQPPAPPAGGAATPRPQHAVAVLPFAAAGETPAGGGAALADLLARRLATSPALRVVDSLRLQRRLADGRLALGELRRDQLDDLADTFQVDRLVRGRLAVEGGGTRLAVEVIEADRPGSEPRALAAVDAPAGELSGLVDGAAGTLGAVLGVELPGTSSLHRPSAAAVGRYGAALQHLSRGEQEAATEALTAAVAEDPSFTAAWLQLSRLYQEQGRGEEALDAARRAVASTGEAAGREAIVARSREAVLSNRPEAAQGILEELVDRYPFDSEAQIALGEAYAQQGKLEEAVARFRQAVATDDTDPRGWYLLGRYSILAGDSRQAVDDYLLKALVWHRRLGNEQGQAEVLNALGVGYQRLGRTDQATENYAEAAKIRERIGDRRGLAATLHNLASLALVRGDYAAAEASIGKALAIHQELGNRVGIANMYNAWGALEEERGRYPEALERYQRALAVREELGDERALGESLNNVGYAYYLEGEYTNARLFFDRALEIYRKNDDRGGMVPALQSVGFCQLVQGEWPAADASFDEALELARTAGRKDAIAVSVGNRGVVAQRQGRYGAAFAAYDEALGILADLGDARGRLEFTLHQAEALTDLGDPDAAERLLDAVRPLQQEAGNREQAALWLVRHAAVHLGRGELAEASRHFEEALAAAEDSSSPSALLEARLGAGLTELARGAAEDAARRLGAVVEAADRLRHVPLELRAAEALAEAELAAGAPRRADEALRRAFRLLDRCGSYARAYRLYDLRAAVAERSGDAAQAAAERQRAAAEVERLRGELGGREALRRAFESLPDVKPLLGLPQAPKAA